MNSDDDLKEAENCYKQGKYDESIRHSNQSIKNKKKESESYLNIGKCYFKQHKSEEAIENFKKSIEIDPNNYQANYAMAGVYLSQEKYGDAFRAYSKVALYLNQSVQLHRQISLCLYQMNRFNESKNEILTALYYDNQKSENERDKLCRVVHVCILNSLEKYDDTLIELDTYLKADPNNTDFIEQKVYALCELNRFEECFELINVHINNNPNLFYYKAKCYYYQGKYKEVIETLNKRDTNKSLIKYKMHFLLAKTLSEIDSYSVDSVIQEYQNAIKENKRYIDAYIQIAKLLNSKKDYKKAEEILNEAEKQIDEQDEKKYQLMFILTKAEVLFNLGKIEEAKTTFDYVTNVLNEKEMEFSIMSSEILMKYFQIYYIKSDIKNAKVEIFPDKKIGVGGFCEVFYGKFNEKEVAIKRYKLNDNSENKFEKEEKRRKLLLSIYKEVSIMDILQHEKNESCEKYHCLDYILESIAFYYEEPDLFLITPLMKGGDLTSLLLHKNLEISKKNRLYILLQVAIALNHMHSYKEPLIHYDIKSLNVLLVKPYNPKELTQVKLIDFGLTRKNLIRRSIEFNCTPGWAAPELIKFQDHDQSIDIYAFGILIWEVFARDQPFKILSKEKIFECVLKGERPPIEALETIIPEKIRKLYIKCVEEEKEKRPSIKEVIEILEECYSTEK